MNREELAEYFYQIANGNIESHTIYDDNYVRGILDINPINLGHTLILPKNKRQEFSELNHDEVISLAKAIKVISKALKKLYSPTGITLMQNGGENSDLNYFHMHVIPRTKDDQFRWTHRELKDFNLINEKQRIVKQLHDHLNDPL